MVYFGACSVLNWRTQAAFEMRRGMYWDVVGRARSLHLPYLSPESLTLSDSITLPNVNQSNGDFTKSHVAGIPYLFTQHLHSSVEPTSSCPGTCTGRTDRVDLGVYYPASPSSRYRAEGVNFRTPSRRCLFRSTIKFFTPMHPSFTLWHSREVTGTAARPRRRNSDAYDRYDKKW